MRACVRACVCSEREKAGARERERASERARDGSTSVYMVGGVGACVCADVRTCVSHFILCMRVVCTCMGVGGRVCMHGVCEVHTCAHLSL